jgi:acyl carrier protein
MDQTAALKLVYDAIDTANELRREEDRIPKTPDVKLVGQDGRLDSLALATLLLAIERRTEEETGESISLLDESGDDLDAQLHRFETPEALAGLIREKLAQ